jgi:hypothetical protein
MTGLSVVPDHVVSSAQRRHRAGVGLVVLAIVAVASGLAGAAIDRYMVMQRLGPLAPILKAGAASPADAHRFAAHVTSELDLSPDQQERVETIIERRMGDARIMRAQVKAQLLGMIDAAQTEIDSVLTPAQRVKFLEIRRRHGYVDAAGHPIVVPPPPS